MSRNRINSLHDALFRQMLANEESRQAMVTDHLKGELRGRLRGPGRLLETTQIDRDKMTRTASDGLVEYRLASGQPALVAFLLEHQSSRDSRAMLKILKRMVAIWEGRLESGKKVDQLPLLIFMLFYHGKRRWKLPSSLELAFGEGDDWLGLRMRGLAVNLTELPPASLSSDAFAQMGFHSLLYGTGALRGFEALTDSVRVLPGARFDKYRTDPYLSTPIVSYMLGLGEDDAATIEAALDIAQPKIGGKTMVMTAADKFRAEGIEQGRQQGIELGRQMAMTAADKFRAEGIEQGKKMRAATAERLLARGKAEIVMQFLKNRYGKVPSGIAQRLQAAKAEQIESWVARLFDGETPEAVFGKAARQ